MSEDEEQSSKELNSDLMILILGQMRKIDIPVPPSKTSMSENGEVQWSSFGINSQSETGGAIFSRTTTEKRRVRNEALLHFQRFNGTH